MAVKKLELLYSFYDVAISKHIWETQCELDELVINDGAGGPVTNMFAGRSESAFRAHKLTVLAKGMTVDIIRDGVKIATYCNGEKL